MENAGVHLRDIKELDPTAWWPLAPGWWFVIMVAIVLFVAIYGFYRSGFAWFDWRRDAQRNLRSLQRRVRTDDVKEVSAALSDLLRRIAIARHGRSACAGLSGTQWLAWLTDNDPAGFDWTDEGRLLLTLPYAPGGSGADDSRNQLKRLVAATVVWIGRETTVRNAGSRQSIRRPLATGTEA